MSVGSGVSEYGDDARNSPTRRRSESMCSFARLALAHHDVRWSIQVWSYDTITATSSHPGGPLARGFRRRRPGYATPRGRGRLTTWRRARAWLTNATVTITHAE